MYLETARSMGISFGRFIAFFLILAFIFSITTICWLIIDEVMKGFPWPLDWHASLSAAMQNAALLASGFTVGLAMKARKHD